MLGKPLFKINEKVEVVLQDRVLEGKIEVIDAYGSLRYPDDVSYDIMINENGEDILYKHVLECLLNRFK